MKIFFPKRIPEPKEMNALDVKVYAEQAQGRYQSWFLPLVDHIIGQTGLKNGIILDIACGPGLLSCELGKRNKNYQVVGVDISKMAIRIAKQNCHKLSNVKFKTASVYDLPFPDNFFDLVVCRDSFHHFLKPTEALKEIKRVTKKGSFFYIQDLRRDTPWRLIKTVTGQSNEFQRLQYYSVRASYLKSELVKLLKNIGWEVKIALVRHLSAELKLKYKMLSNLRDNFSSHLAIVVRKK